MGAYGCHIRASKSTIKKPMCVILLFKKIECKVYRTVIKLLTCLWEQQSFVFCFLGHDSASGSGGVRFLVDARPGSASALFSLLLFLLLVLLDFRGNATISLVLFVVFSQDPDPSPHAAAVGLLAFLVSDAKDQDNEADTDNHKDKAREPQGVLQTPVQDSHTRVLSGADRMQGVGDEFFLAIGVGASVGVEVDVAAPTLRKQFEDGRVVAVVRPSFFINVVTTVVGF